MKSFTSYVNGAIDISVSNPAKTAQALEKVGLHVTPDTHSVSVRANSSAEKKRLVNWMLKNGFDKIDIMDDYPELEQFV